MNCCDFHGHRCEQGRKCPHREIDNPLVTPEQAMSPLFWLRTFAADLQFAIKEAAREWKRLRRLRQRRASITTPFD